MCCAWWRAACATRRSPESSTSRQNTVGFHLKNVFGKLDAHTRTEAVARARELTII